MLKKFKTLPAPIRIQFAVRFWLGIVFLIACLCILAFTRDLILSFPCLAIAVFLLANCALMFFRGTRNKFVAVNGICTDVKRTHIRKQIKYICMLVGEISVRFPVRKRLKRLAAGDVITLYLPESARVYEKGGSLVVFDYYAFEINDVGKMTQ